MTDTHKYIERFCHGENVLDLLREAEKRIDSLEMELALYRHELQGSFQPKTKRPKPDAKVPY